jgi:hypothetical protein
MLASVLLLLPCMQAMAEVTRQGLYPNPLLRELVPLGSGTYTSLTHSLLCCCCCCVQAMVEVTKQGLDPNPLVTELVPLGSGAEALLTHTACSAFTAAVSLVYGGGHQAGPVPQPAGI